MIDVEKNINNHHRGLHLVVINEKSGHIEFTRCFDTFESTHEFDSFITSGGVPHGKIVAAACKDDCEKNMSWLGK